MPLPDWHSNRALPCRYFHPDGDAVADYASDGAAEAYPFLLVPFQPSPVPNPAYHRVDYRRPGSVDAVGDPGGVGAYSRGDPYRSDSRPPAAPNRENRWRSAAVAVRPPCPSNRPSPLRASRGKRRLIPRCLPF